MTTAPRKVYCRRCGRYCGELPDGLLIAGTRLLCVLCDEAVRANEQALRQIQLQPELLRRTLKLA